MCFGGEGPVISTIDLPDVDACLDAVDVVDGVDLARTETASTEAVLETVEGNELTLHVLSLAARRDPVLLGTGFLSSDRGLGAPFPSTAGGDVACDS